MATLAELGYDILFIWQHELKNVDKLKQKITHFHTK